MKPGKSQREPAKVPAEACPPANRQSAESRADFVRARSVAHLTDRDPDLRDFLEWFFWTGMRPGGIRNLTWAAFDRETWRLRLPAKHDKIRRGLLLPLVGPLRAIVERRLAARRLDCPLIFHRDGQPIRDFRKAWKTACRAAGLVSGRDGRVPYDLRRTGLRNMIRGGVDIAVAMKISGHRTRSTFDRYNITDDEDLEDAILKTADYVATLPTERVVLPLKKTSGKP